MKRIGLLLGAVLAVAVLFNADKWLGTWRDGKHVQWKIDSAQGAAETRATEGVAAKTDTVYRTVTVGYRADRTTALSSPTATARDTALFKMCDAVVSACDERHAADTAVASALRRELAIARAKPSERAKRFNLYGEGMYDLLSAAPVFRAGAELRVIGGIHAAAAGDLAIPPAGQARVQTRALVGVRYTF